MRIKLGAISAVCIGVLNAAAIGHEGDVGIRVSGGRLETVLATGEPPIQTFGTEIERVFAAELGWSAATNTVVSDEPGFALGDAALVGQNLSFNIRRALRRWDGMAFVATSTTMSAGNGDLGLDFIATPMTDVLTSGHTIVVPSGGLDFHYDWRLDGADATMGRGIYLVELELTNPEGTFVMTDPFWIVYNYGEAELEHAAAIDWTSANLAPAPGAGGMLLASLAVMGWRRRR